MFEIIQLQFEVYECMNMTSPQRRTGSSKVKSGKLPGKTLQKPHDRRRHGMWRSWLHRSDGSLLHDHPRLKKNTNQVLTLGLAIFFTNIHHDTTWSMLRPWMVHIHPSMREFDYLQRIRKEELRRGVIKIINRHYNHHLPTLMVSSCGIHLAMFNKSAWIFSDPLALSSTAKQKQGDVILEKSPLASQNSWFQHVEQTHLNKKNGPLLSASWIGCLYLYLLLRWIYTFI